MRKNKRLYCSGFSIAFLLLSIIVQNGQNTNESDLSDYIQKDRYSIASFIEKNLEEVALKYNEHSTKEWNPTFIENKFDINVNDGNLQIFGVFLDFNNDHADVRTVVNDRFKKVDGGTVSETAAIIERVAKKYGYNVDARENPAWAVSIADGVTSINSSKPFLWSTSCDTYGSHTMAVCGYKRYTKTTGWWIFKSEESKLFFELRDGWTAGVRYFDISGYVGFGAFITLHF